MILDVQGLFSNAQALTGAAASTNVVDLGAPGTPVGAAAALGQDIGAGVPIPILIQVVAAITGTLVATIQVDDNSGFTSAKSVAAHTFPATAAAGTQAAIMYVPKGTDERYMRINYTGATGGSVTAGFTMGNQTNG